MHLLALTSKKVCIELYPEMLPLCPEVEVADVRESYCPCLLKNVVVLEKIPNVYYVEEQIITLSVFVLLQAGTVSPFGMLGMVTSIFFSLDTSTSPRTIPGISPH